MPHGDFVAFRHLHRVVLADCRRDGAPCAEDESTHEDELRARKARCAEHGGEQACHEEAMMAGQKDVFVLREARDEEIENKSHDQNAHRLDAEHFLCDGCDGLVVRYDARDVESRLDHLAERVEIGDDDTSARTEHEVAEYGLERSRHDFVGGTPEGDKSDEGHDAD